MNCAHTTHTESTQTNKQTRQRYTHSNTQNTQTRRAFEVEASRCGTTLPPAGVGVKFSSERCDIIEASQSNNTETGGKQNDGK